MRNILGTKLFSVRETAEILGVTPASVNNYTKIGLKVTRVGKRRFFKEEAIRNFLKETQ